MRPQRLLTMVLLFVGFQVPAVTAPSEWQSQFRQAREYAVIGDHALAAETYRQILKTYKDPFSANNLALLYKEGRGVPKNSKAAIHLLKLSVAYGSSKVFKFPGSPETTLGWLYLNGNDDLDPDLDEARRWTLEAARQGHPNAHSNLALMYVAGLGVPVDYVAAVAQLKLAIERYRDDFNWTIEEGEETLWIGALKGAIPEIREARRLYWESLRSSEKIPYLNSLTAIQTKLMAAAEQAPSKRENGKKVSVSRTHSTGSSFLITSDGLLVTNAHVVGACSAIFVHSDRRKERVEILSKDPIQDIAFLKLKDYKSTRNLPLRENQPTLAEDLMVAGYPFGTSISSELKITKGIVSALVGPQDNRAFIQIDAAVQPGNSGGPAIDLDGRVVGMVTSKLDPVKASERLGAFPESVSFALKVGAIRAYAEELGYGAKINTSIVARDQVARRLSDAVFRVSCAQEK